MKHNLIFSAILFIVLILGASACSTTQEDATLNMLCTVAENQCEGMTKEFESRFNIKVNYARMSSGEALTRLREEKDNPQFDIWWGGPIDGYIVAKNEGLLAPYNSPNYNNLINQNKYKDPDNYWGGVYVGSLGFCTNKNWLNANPGVEPPRSWDDLLKPEFKNQIIFAHPSSSGTAYTLLSTILQLKGEEAGWLYMQQLADQVYQFTKAGNAGSGIVGEGEVAVCVTFSHDIVHRIENEDAPLLLTFPEEGNGYEIGGVALLNGAKNPATAKKWFDWILTAEAQSLGPQYFAYQAPTVKGVDLAYPKLLEVNLIDYDFIWSAEHKTKFVDKFTKEIATADNLRK